MFREDIPMLVQIDQLSNSPAWTKEMFEKELDLPQSLNRIACLGKLPIGFGIVWVVAGEAQLLEFAVQPQHRGAGVGSRLLRDMAGESHRRGCKKMVLELRHRNRDGLKFYERIGFENRGIRKNFYENDDAILMECALPLK